MTNLESFAVPAFTIMRDEAGAYRYASANEALLRWAGVEAADLIGQTPHRVVGERTGTQVAAGYERCLAERSVVEHQGSACLPTGLSRWRTVLIPMTEPDGTVSSLLGLVCMGAEDARVSLDLAVLNRHLDLAIRSLKGADWRYDVERQRYEASPNLALLFGEGQPRDVPWSEWESRIFPEDLPGSSCAALVEGAMDEQVVTFRFHGHDGETRWARCRRVLAADGLRPVVCGVVTDITEEVAREQQLLHEARTDSLTRLLNRRGFRHYAEELRASDRAASASLAVFMLDLDEFKRINDELGHAVGDLVLVEVGRRLSGIFGSGAVLARLGGDEFAAAMPGVTQREANRLAEEIGAALSRPLMRPEGAVPVSGSVGLCWCADGRDAHAMMTEADDRLYRAKRARKSRLAGSDAERQINLFAA